MCKNILCALKVFLCALISQLVCTRTRTQLKGNIGHGNQNLCAIYFIATAYAFKFTSFQLTLKRLFRFCINLFVVSSVSLRVCSTWVMDMTAIDVRIKTLMRLKHLTHDEAKHLLLGSFLFNKKWLLATCTNITILTQHHAIQFLLKLPPSFQGSEMYMLSHDIALLVTEHWWCWWQSIDCAGDRALMVLVTGHWWCWWQSIDGAGDRALMVLVTGHWWCWWLGIDGAGDRALIVLMTGHWWCWWLGIDGAEGTRAIILLKVHNYCLCGRFNPCPLCYRPNTPFTRSPYPNC